MAVAFDVAGSRQLLNGSNVNYTGLTSTAAANALFAVMFVSGASLNPTSPFCVWDPAGANQQMTKLGSVIGSGARYFVAIFGLVLPTSFGNKTVNFSYTNSGNGWFNVWSLTGVKTSAGDSGGFTHFNSSNLSATAQSLSITTTGGAGNAVFGAITSSPQTFTGANGTQDFNETNWTGTPSAAVQHFFSTAGGAQAVNWTANGTTNTCPFVGCEVIPGPVVTPPSLSDVVGVFMSEF